MAYFLVVVGDSSICAEFCSLAEASLRSSAILLLPGATLSLKSDNAEVYAAKTALLPTLAPILSAKLSTLPNTPK